MQKQNQCPLHRKIDILYEAKLTKSPVEERIYTRTSEKEFKEKYASHLLSCKYEIYKNNTILSKYIWELKKKKPLVEYIMQKVKQTQIEIFAWRRNF